MFSIELIFTFILIGLVVGGLVGFLGVGGGAVMTPLLILMGLPPSVAVGTDLLYAFVTKTFGVCAYHHRYHIDWSIVKYFCLGSLSMAVLCLVLFYFYDNAGRLDSFIESALCIILFICAAIFFVGSFINPKKTKQLKKLKNAGYIRYRRPLLFIAGMFLGFLITTTSVGSGSIGIVILLLLLPGYAFANIVGIDLAQALPIIFVASLGHMFLGHVDYGVVACLLTGSIPGVLLASRLHNRVPDRWPKLILSLFLFGLASSLVIL